MLWKISATPLPFDLQSLPPFSANSVASLPKGTSIEPRVCVLAVPTPPPQKKAKISYENYIKKKSTDTVKISMMPPTGKVSTVVEFEI